MLMQCRKRFFLFSFILVWLFSFGISEFIYADAGRNLYLVYKAVAINLEGWDQASRLLYFGGQIGNFIYDTRDDALIDVVAAQHLRMHEEKSTTISPAKLSHFNIKSGFSVSPDSEFIIYLREPSAAESNNMTLHIGNVDSGASVDTKLALGKDAPFNVAWSKNSRSFAVISGGDDTYQSTGLVAIGSNFHEQMSTFKLWTLAPFENGGVQWQPTNFSDYPVADRFELSEDGNFVLFGIRSVDRAEDASDNEYRLAVINLQSLERSQIINGVDAKQLSSATFVPNESSRLFLIDNKGLALYDLETNTSTILDKDIAFPWVRTALFSPDKAFLAIVHSNQEQEIYLLKMPDVTNVAAVRLENDLLPRTQKLIVEPLCSENPTAYRRWHVYNPNAYPLLFTWNVEGSPADTGTEMMSGNAITTFKTPYIFHTPNSVRLFVKGVYQSRSEGDDTLCSPATPAITQ